MAFDDQSAERTAQVLRNAIETLNRTRGRPSTLWEDMTPTAREAEIARIQESIDAEEYTVVETDEEALALEEAIVTVILPDAPLPA
jgi:hypothetical protein